MAFKVSWLCHHNTARTAARATRIRHTGPRMAWLLTPSDARATCDTISGFMRIAFDTGGTFTDCVYLRGGRLEILKVPSTPRKPSEAIAHALGRIAESGVDLGGLELICGTTVGTNALLQRKGGRVTLVTTAGFEDVLEIGRQARPQLYNLLFEKPEPLVPRARRLGLRERLDSDGRVLLAPSARGDRANRARCCAEQSRFRRRLPALFFCESGAMRNCWRGPLPPRACPFPSRTKSFPNIANSNAPRRPS